MMCSERRNTSYLKYIITPCQRTTISRNECKSLTSLIYLCISRWPISFYNQSVVSHWWSCRWTKNPSKYYKSTRMRRLTVVQRKKTRGVIAYEETWWQWYIVLYYFQSFNDRLFLINFASIEEKPDNLCISKHEKSINVTSSMTK